MITFNDILRITEIDPKTVLIMRHKEKKLGRILPWLAAEKHEDFVAYQSSHSRMAEASLRNRPLIASFVNLPDDRDVFVGIYRNLGNRPITETEFLQMPEHQLLLANGFYPDKWREDQLWFDLERLGFMQEYSGRLLIEWDGGRTFNRLAENNKFTIAAILEDDALSGSMPEWRELVLSWSELKTLPIRWASALSEWRGIYFIHDENDGQGYVGSAYGEDNILGRWNNYAKTGHGGNKLLKKRDPMSFRFSILQRVSPDMEPDEIIRLEASWKERLHTRKHGLNEN